MSDDKDLFPPIGGGNENKETPKKKEKKESNEVDSLKVQLENQAKELEELKALIKNISVAAPAQSQDLSLASAINNLAKTQERQIEEQYKPNAYKSPDSIDPKDFLEKADVFYTYATTFVVGDDKRMGVPVQSPIGPVTFTLAYTKVVNAGMADQIINYAVFKSHSKKLSAWLRSHSKFGIKFWEWSDVKDKNDYKKVAKIIKFSEALQDMSAVRVIDMCKSYGVEFTPDNIPAAKIKLIERLTDNELKEESGMNDTTFNASMLKRNQEIKNSLQLAEDIDRHGY